MNATGRGVPPSLSATVDPSNPWLGLASFTEESRDFFYGRESEVAELARRVQRKLLTVLFGQSGLGKTSILRAGLVPRLRGHGYCPVYVRIDYGKDTPEPAEQIKQAIRQAANLSGEWSQVGVAAAGESLWEFLHHRDDILRDEAGSPLIPLLIFDQFEEIFTLAQTDEHGRARATRFLEQLADLVENRPPQSLEARLDADDSAAERFDFARSDYRVLIALREDYLAPLEGLKATMPSIAQNRLRLAPMTGTQALAAVLQPGKRLVSEEVAAAIVRFVAGGAELANAEVEPSLLSLICRELNDARKAAGRSEISLDLLAGSHASILSNFYERSLADQPAAVRRVIEDDLLTASGFRENVAEERLLSRFAAVGAATGTLALLVNRRLLRIEERLDVRRVELTHDVLCGVVKASRDQRQEREAREATQRLLAEQRERELSARRALVRARQVAAVCTGLAIVAVAAAGFAYFSLRRAQHAELEAQETKATAVQARSQAEHLLGYLSDDFGNELESFGRLNVVTEFTQRQIDYFHGLPAGLRDPETVRNGALALVHHGRALRLLGNQRRSLENATEAIHLLEAQTAKGDRSEATLVALAQAYLSKSQILDNEQDPAGLTFSQRAEALLRPVAEKSHASPAANRAYVELLVRLSWEQQNANHNEAVLQTTQRAKTLAASLGARDLSNPDMGSYYAEAGAWQTGSLAALGRNEEARRVAHEDIALAEKVLELRPGNRIALHAEQVLASNVVTAEINMLDPAAALLDIQRMEKVSSVMLGMDPNNVTSLNNTGVAYQLAADSLWAAGRPRESIAAHAVSMDYYSRSASSGAVGFVVIRAASSLSRAMRQAQSGDFSGARAEVDSGAPFLAKLRGSNDAFAYELIEAADEIPLAKVALERGDAAAAERVALAAAQELRTQKPNSDLERSENSVVLYMAVHVAGQAAYQLGRFAAAEQHEREALAARKIWGTQATPDQRDLGESSTWLAMAIAQQARNAEAQDIIAPVVKFQRELAARNRSDRRLAYELALALYAQSLSDRTHSPALRQEATRLLNTLAPELRSLPEVQRLRQRISETRG
jgi:hypothetical protein